MDDDAAFLQAPFIQPLHDATKIISLISENFLTFHLGKPSIYRLERHNHHEKMKDMVEDMDP